MNTLLLTLDRWDLCLDSSNGIAVASDPYSVQQDVASACRTFLGDLWYDTAAGIPYFQQILGQFPPLELVKQWLVTQALTVPGCTNPVVYISTFSDRQISGQVQFTDSNGTTQAAGF
jgi:hypothetical protein